MCGRIPGPASNCTKSLCWSHATAIAGSYTPATVQFTLSGTVTTLDYVGIVFLSEHYPYQMNAGDTLDWAIQNIVAGCEYVFADHDGHSERNDDYTYLQWGRSNRRYWGERQPGWRLHLCFQQYVGDMGRTVEDHVRRYLTYSVADRFAVRNTSGSGCGCNSGERRTQASLDILSGVPSWSFRSKRVSSGGFRLGGDGYGEIVFGGRSGQ